MQITYRERLDRMTSLYRFPSFPPGATADEIEAIMAAEGATVMTDEKVPRLSTLRDEGVTPDGGRAVKQGCRTDRLNAQSFGIRAKSAITKVR